MNEDRKKCNKGFHVNVAWAIGGVEEVPKEKVFMVILPNKISDTLTAYMRSCESWIHPRD